MYIWDFSRSVGDGSATTRNTRGLTRPVIALIVPPLPALSRPSNKMHTLLPDAFTHSWRATSSACSRLSSVSYSLRFIFVTSATPRGPAARAGQHAILARTAPDAGAPDRTGGGIAGALNRASSGWR